MDEQLETTGPDVEQPHPLPVWADPGVPDERLDGQGVSRRGLIRRAGIFQGLEWYIPAAEHVTLFTAPGPNEAEVLRQFELAYDGKLLGRSEGNVDVVRGAVRGAAADRDNWRAPDTRVAQSIDVSGRTGTYTLRIPLTGCGLYTNPIFIDVVS